MKVKLLQIDHEERKFYLAFIKRVKDGIGACQNTQQLA